MIINISKKDIIWAYFADFFYFASSLITLPVILNLLSPEEIGMNYIIMTIGSIVSLFDFGFGFQFGRNITYVFSGVNTLSKDSVEKSNFKEINYKLLVTMIMTAKYVYKRISIIVFFLLLTIGTLYMSYITDNFNSVNNSLIIWLIYCCSTYFNIYYTYYFSLLIGKGLIKESKKAMVASKLVNILITLILLYFNFELLAIAIANLISPFVSRFLSDKYFFTSDIKEKINFYKITNQEVKELFNIIWHNAKKIGIISVAASTITYLTTFILSLFLSLHEVASYGLMVQFTGILCVISTSMFDSMLPNISYLHVNKNEEKFKNKLSLSIVVFYAIFIMGSLLLIFIAPYFLKLIESKTILPTTFVLVVYLCFNFFEKHQSIFSQILLIENKVPFMKAAVLTGITALVLVFSALFLNLGIEVVVLVQAIPTLLYSAWKWPLLVFKKFNILFYNDVLVRGFLQIVKHNKL